MQRRLYYGWWIIAGCIAAQMDLGFAKDAMDVYMTYIVADFGWTRADFQLAGWATLGTYSLAGPAIGALLDRIGARTVISLGALSLGAAFAGYASMTGFGQYLVSTAFLGFGFAAVGDVPVSTVASRWFDRHRGAVLGIVLLGSNLGGAIINLLAKALYRGFDDSWRAGLLAIAGLMLAVVLPFSLFVLREPPAAGARAHGVAPRSDGGRGDLSLAGAARTRSLWLIAFALFAYYFYYFFANRHIIALLRDHESFGRTVPPLLVWLLGVRPEDFPELTKSVFEISGIPAKLLAGVWLDRYPVRHALAWNFALLAGGSALFLVLDAPGALWLFMVVHGVAWGAQQVLTPMTLARCFGLRHMGQIYGTLLLVLFPAQLGTWYAGRVFDTTGSYAGFYPYFLALNALAAAGLFLVKRKS
jgi:MFS family permease